VTFDERVAKVRPKGFTERQARFLVTVMLHSGVCMVRQYCAFSRIARGQKTQDFFGSLLARKYATVSVHAHRKVRVFHVQHRSLYEAIGEPDNRFRKPVPMGAAIERLMLLDSVLASPEIVWLSTERDKLAYFTRLLGTGFRREELPHLAFGRPGNITVRFFPDKMPIGTAPDGRSLVFAYLVRRSSPIDFRAFLQRHAELLRALPLWRIRLLCPGHLVEAREAYLAAFRQELAMPLRPSTAQELRWFFEHQEAPPGALSPESARFARARQAFASPRYRVLYRAWLREGARAVDSVVSPVLADAIREGTAQAEWRVLSHPYLHLSSLVGTA
jgi:hypothetical protein